MLGKRARPVRAGGRRKRARARRHLADGLPVLVHGKGDTVGVRLHLTPDHLCVEVRDGSPWVTRPPADPLAQRGRGLLLVEALADAWGITEDGGCVWCVLRRDLPQAPR